MLTESQLAAKRKWMAKNRERILAYRKKYYEENKARVLAINKKWADANPEKVSELRHAYYEANKQTHNEKCREWDKKNRGKSNASKTKWIKSNPEARKAHGIVQQALAKGTLKKQPCSCGRKDVHAHHKDYSKPLDVTWLCPQCHKNVHKEREQT